MSQADSARISPGWFMLCSNGLSSGRHAHVVRADSGFSAAGCIRTSDGGRLSGERLMAQGRDASDGGSVLGNGEVQVVLCCRDPLVDVCLVGVVQGDLGVVQGLCGSVHRGNRLLVGSVCH